jgi:hypothetical protein
MSKISKESLIRQLKDQNLTQEERHRLEFKLYKLYKKENLLDWDLMIFFGSVILFMLLFTFTVHSK